MNALFPDSLSLSNPTSARSAARFANEWPFTPISLIPPADASLKDEPGAPLQAGTFQFQSMAHHYRLYVPPAPAEIRSLLVMLHGCAQTAEDFALGTRMNDLAGAANTAVLYLQQSHSANSHGCWNWYDEDHQARGQGEPAWIAALTQMVACKLRVDANRIFVAGLSAGGTMAATVARAYPELFAACAVHSGLPAGAAKGVINALWTMRCGASVSSGDGERQIPTIVFHGDADTTVHPSHGRHAVEAALGDTTKHSGSGATSPRFADGILIEGPCYTQRKYSTSQGALQAEHWQLTRVGHAWSGGDLAGSHTEADGPSASAEFLRFFNDIASQSESRDEPS